MAITTVCQRRVSDAELEAYLEEFGSSIAARTGPYATVLDLTHSTGLTPAQRKRLTDQMNGDPHGILDRCACTALVFQSALLRGMLTAIFWLRNRRDTETQVFGDPDSAVAWCEARLPTPTRAPAAAQGRGQSG